MMSRRRVVRGQVMSMMGKFWWKRESDDGSPCGNANNNSNPITSINYNHLTSPDGGNNHHDNDLWCRRQSGSRI